jgi:hypothetical protein
VGLHDNPAADRVVPRPASTLGGRFSKLLEGAACWLLLAFGRRFCCCEGKMKREKEAKGGVFKYGLLVHQCTRRPYLNTPLGEEQRQSGTQSFIVGCEIFERPDLDGCVMPWFSLSYER